MIDPSLLISMLLMTVQGTYKIAGRDAIKVTAVPRHPDSNEPTLWLEGGRAKDHE